nr:methyl-accepting chemotaxis protein [Acinetobacter sp. Marseille-Q1620]
MVSKLDQTKLNGSGKDNSAGNSNEHSGFFHLLGDNEQSKSHIRIAILSLVVALGILVYMLYSVPKHNTLTRSLGELKLLSQTISRQAIEATSSGSDQALKELNSSKDSFSTHLKVVQNSFSKQKEFKDIEQSWSKLSKDISTITAQQKVLNQLYDTNIALNESVPKVQADYNLLVEQMAKADYSSDQILIAKNQVFLAERLLNASESLLNPAVKSKVNSRDFSADTEAFGSYLTAQLNGNSKLKVARVEQKSMRETLLHIQSGYEKVLKPASSIILKNANEIVQIQQATSEIAVLSSHLLVSLNQLSVGDVSGTIIPGLLLIVALALFLYHIFKILVSRVQADQIRNEADKKNLLKLKNDNDRKQEAILRLLDEIGDLADGDLRTYATVSEDVTGAIADSINFAIEQLRELVSRINETSQEVSRYSQDTQNLTNQLADASEHQAQEIAGASVAINEIVNSIEDVSSNASESAMVAQRSVELAENGANVVNRSIAGMDTIREQIQETAKRIKRLGESSQEIGNIVALINDIADQTNILALNAAIQASTAGEAGRGFAVVADEVQRLAERSTSATKQIETLVKTIQMDTNEAVISMELTTTEVVRGANLAKDAGLALDEIQNVSHNLAKLIESISDATQLQSASAGHIAHTMNVVQEITAQTTGATFDTARSVSELANLADSLRHSVSDFKLPE